MMKSRRGFTIVEVLVVISIIGILATITFMGFGRYQADTRDSARASQAKIISESLEKYFEQNGEYPSCPALTGTATSVTTSVLPGVEPQTLVTPQAPAGTTNSIQCADLTSTSQPDFFAYIGDNSAACLSGSACIAYQLKYEQETTGQIVTIDSRHHTGLVVTGAPTLSVAPDSTNGFAQLNSTWTAIAGSNSYDLQRSTSSDFSTSLVTSNTTSTTFASTGLSYNTTYYFRIRANSTISNGPWSGVSIATTWSLATPVVSASATSTTTFTSSWPAITHAANYNVQCSSDNTTWGSGCAASTTATSFGWGPTSQGTRLYFRTQAVNGSYTSAWSASAGVTSPIDAPAAYTMDYGNTSATWNFISATSNAVCPANTTPSYDWYSNGNFWVSGTQYKSVSWQYSAWNQTVTLSVASRCITGATSSSFVWANNTGTRSLTAPTVWAGLIAYRTAGWGATCPIWTSSSVYYFSVHGTGSVGYVQSGATQATSWNGGAYSWGNGDIRAAIVCSGPWGDYRVDSGPAPFGPGCVPTITVSECTW